MKSRYNTKLGFRWFNTIESDLWHVQISELLFRSYNDRGRIKGDKQLELGNTRAVMFDTGNSDLSLPRDIYIEFMKMFDDLTPIEAISGFFSTSCENSNKLRDELILTLDGKRVFVSISGLYHPLYPYTGQCVLRVKQTIRSYIVLGTPFHRPFYTSYDYTRKQIGIAAKV